MTSRLHIIDFKEAISYLNQGKNIIMPTETVYGLAADATISSACQNIYSLKGRPSDNPLIVHVKSLEAVDKVAKVTSLAEKLASAFWPGPLTIILEAKEESVLSKFCISNKKTSAFRMPNHLGCYELLKEIDYIAAPSANKSTKISPSTFLHASHVAMEYGIPIVKGQDSEIGIESTIVDARSDVPIILRHGVITKEDIEDKLNLEVKFGSDTDRQIAPGNKYKHYSPNAKIRINADKINDFEVFIHFGPSQVQSNYFTISLSKSSDLKEAAHNFYHYLKIADEKCVSLSETYGHEFTIAVGPIPNEGIGIAINEKLIKAAG
jgi:L-threonylcarbamoyladenylate synthase